MAVSPSDTPNTSKYPLLSNMQSQNSEQKSTIPNLRDIAVRDEEKRAREAAAREEAAAMFNETSVDTRVLSAKYDRVSVSLNKKLSDLDILEAIFSPKRTEGFPINKRSNALVLKAEGLLNSLNKEVNPNDSQKRLKAFLERAVPEAKRMAELTADDTTLV